jgi:hypothetical protein
MCDCGERRWLTIVCGCNILVWWLTRDNVMRGGEGGGSVEDAADKRCLSSRHCRWEWNDHHITWWCRRLDHMLQ